MRPLNLTIAAFGTYTKEEHINFEKLGKEGLYLITGDTGSGKTTIFDAITFALYGIVNGDNRKPEMLRSTYADLNTPTYVELEFEFKGHKYKVTRNPKYIKAKRGGGTTEQTPNASLYRDTDGAALATSYSEVTKKIEEIIGLDEKQFTQIAMIAQGNFQKLLFEESKTRQDLFTSLFKTEKYKKLQEVLKEKAKSLKNENKDLNNFMYNQLNNISCDEQNSFYEKLQQAKSVENWDERIEVIQKVINEDEVVRRKIASDKTENQKLLDKVKLELDEINRVKADKEQADDIAGKLEKAEKLINSLDESVQVKKIVLDENPERQKEKALIENDIAKYDDLELKTGKINELKAECEKLQKLIEKAASEISLKEKKIKDNESELATLKDADLNNQKLVSEKEKILEKINSLEELAAKCSIISSLEGKLGKVQKEYITASEKAQSANEEYGAKNKAYLDGQAGILAGKLEENMPCPVCGSVHHPNPCKAAVSVPKEDELNELRELAETLTGKATEKSNEASGVIAELKSKKEDFSNYYKKVFNNNCNIESEELLNSQNDFISGELNKTNESLEKINSSLKEESEKMSRKTAIEESLPKIKEDVEKLKAESTNNNNNLLQKETELKGLEKQIEELKSGLKFESKKDAQSKITDLERKINNAVMGYEDAVKQLNKNKENYNSLKGQLQEVNDRIACSKVSDEEDVLSKFNSLTEKENELNRRNDSIVGQIKLNIQAFENIKENAAKLVENNKKYNIVSNLSYTANGETDDLEKIDLETYVQMSYFDKVLQFANVRLLMMSNGQYELVREIESGNKKSKTGLNINVIDHYSGKERSVKSLSGGETFQASLALALGLSDEVSSSAGGIQLDTMFIDEGFGTLDSETMQNAYKALVSLSKGSKLIGIISHVEYLKEVIDRQIIVKKTRNEGSSVTIKL